MSKPNDNNSTPSSSMKGLFGLVSQFATKENATAVANFGVSTYRSLSANAQTTMASPTDETNDWETFQIKSDRSNGEHRLVHIADNLVIFRTNFPAIAKKVYDLFKLRYQQFLLHNPAEDLTTSFLAHPIWHSIIYEKIDDDENTIMHLDLDRTVLSSILRNCNPDMTILGNRFAQNPMHSAAELGALSNIVALYAYGIDPSAIDGFGDTALHIAARGGHVEVVKCLLCFGVDVNLRNTNGETVMNSVQKCSDTTKRKAMIECLTLMINGSSLPKTNITTASPLEAYEQRAAYENRLKLNQQPMQGAKFCNVLSLDGGGMRGLILIQTLLYLESQLKCDILTKFHWLAGTSTGAIIAIALATGKSLRAVQKLYLRFKDQVFTGKRPYSQTTLEEFLQKEFGPSTTMAQLTGRRIMITTTNVDNIPPRLKLLRNYLLPGSDRKLNEAEGFDDPSGIQLWQAARRSSAAPTYFPCVKDASGSWMDGGLVANNPTLDLLVDMQRMNSAARMANQANLVVAPGCVVSLGTGKVNPKQLKGGVDLAVPSGWLDAVFKAKSLLELKDLLVEQVTEAEGEPVRRSRAMAHTLGAPFFRFSPPPMAVNVALDEIDDARLVEMLWNTERYLRCECADDMALLLRFLNA